ncbi:uncharacterized protein LOC142140148 [Mixophyes fleayi]|uniref:uncharacterized protein LOC142140148 n=1 Tax=Mixophyes fleayi TaxID=3061075 RepID=UPI003F4DFA7D
MDPGHHTAFLLVILICILLLVLAVSALLMCYCRRKGFNIRNQKSSMRFGGLMRDQATSMTSFNWNLTEPKFHIYSGCEESQAYSLPITADRSSQRGKHLSSHLFLDSHILSISDNDEGSQTSQWLNKSVRKKSESSGLYSGLQCMLSSVLERRSVFSLKAKRRSSSLKSGIDSDMLMVPLESPVHLSSLPRDLSRSSTVLCENSSEQQFTWDTAGLSILSSHTSHKESCSVPSTLQRKPCNSEEDSRNMSIVQQQKPDCLQPKAWFVSFRNRPKSDGAQLEDKDLNNVTSLDSGVDVIEAQLRTGCDDLNNVQKSTSVGETESHVSISLQQHSELNREYEIQVQGECKELYISHQEAARKLNPGHYGRSVWEKREERPLIGVN